MVHTLREQIRQKRPFSSLEQEAFLNILRTAALLSDSFDRVLKPWGITTAQYNVLRILRGSEPEGLCRNEVRDRMLIRMPDMTRLVDRMEEAQLVTRTRNEEDRRLVSTHLTQDGRKLVDQMDGAIAEEHKRRLGHLSEAQLGMLVELLTAARAEE